MFCSVHGEITVRFNIPVFIRIIYISIPVKGQTLESIAPDSQMFPLNANGERSLVYSNPSKGANCGFCSNAFPDKVVPNMTVMVTKC